MVDASVLGSVGGLREEVGSGKWEYVEDGIELDQNIENKAKKDFANFKLKSTGFVLFCFVSSWYIIFPLFIAAPVYLEAWEGKKELI